LLVAGMARVLRIAAAAAVALTLAVFAVLKHDSRSGTDYVSFNLAHTSLPIHSSDLAISDEHDASVIMQLLDAAASSSAVSLEDEHALSDRLFQLLCSFFNIKVYHRCWRKREVVDTHFIWKGSLPSSPSTRVAIKGSFFGWHEVWAQSLVLLKLFFAH